MMSSNVAVDAMDEWLEENSDVHEQSIVKANDDIENVIDSGMGDLDSEEWSFDPSMDQLLKIYYDGTAGEDLSPLVDQGYRVGLIEKSHTAVAVPDFTYAPKWLTKNSRDTEDVLTESAQENLRKDNLWMIVIMKQSDESVNLQIRKQDGEVFEHYHQMTSTRDCLGFGSDFGFSRLFDQPVREWPEIIKDIKDRYETAVRTVVLDSPGNHRPDDLPYTVNQLNDKVQNEYSREESWNFS